MSIHKSFATKGRLKKHRNVLSRAERIAKLAEEERFGEAGSVFGLPKVRNLKPKKRAKAAKKDDAAEDAASAEGAAEKKPAG